MALQIPFGQYLPGTTPIHRMNARVKFLLALAYTYAIFGAYSWWTLGFLTVAMIIGYLVAKVPFKIALRGLKPLLFILVFTVLASALSFSVVDGMTAAGTPAVSIISTFGYKPIGLERGFYYAMRIALLVVATSLVTFTTSAIQLADALVSLMRPLRVFHVPVEDIATMFSIALRFIPITAEEAMRIQEAQRARGAVFGQGKLVERVKAWVPVFVPLFIGLFRRADDLACAMDARCYTGEGRTRLEKPVMRRADLVILIVGVAICVALGVIY